MCCTWWQPTCRKTTLLYTVTRWIYRTDIRCDRMHDRSIYKCDEMQSSFKESVQKETHSDDRSQYYRLTTQSYRLDYTEWRKRGMRRFTIDQAAYTRGFILYKSHIHTHALSQREERVYLGKLNVWSEVFWSMVFVQGIGFEVLTPGIWSKALVLSGFGPWYWERLKTIKGGEDH